MNAFINLLPWTSRKAQLIRLRLLQWSVVWGVVAGVTVAACVERWDQCNVRASEAEQLETAYAPTGALLAEIKTLNRGVEQLQAREAAVAQLEPSRPALALLALVSRSARECEGRLRVEQLTLHGEEKGTRAGGRGTGGAAETPLAAFGLPLSSVTIKGAAVDDLAVARFVLALRQTNAFDRVELKSSQGQVAGDGEKRRRGEEEKGRRGGSADRSSPSLAPSLRSYEVECGY